MSKHVRLIDSDNLRGRDLTRAQVAKIRTAIEACLVLDGNGKTVAWAARLAGVSVGTVSAINQVLKREGLTSGSKSPMERA